MVLNHRPFHSSGSTSESMGGMGSKDQSNSEYDLTQMFYEQVYIMFCGIIYIIYILYTTNTPIYLPPHIIGWSRLYTNS